MRIIIILAIAIFTQPSCKSKNFSAPNPVTEEAPPIDTETPIEDNTFTSTFKINEDKRPLDIIWAIDSSGSMTDELKQVEKNLASFITKISNFAEVKVFVVADKDENDLFQEAIEDSCPQCLSTNKISFIDMKISSEDSFAVMAGQICDEKLWEITSDNYLNLCNQKIDLNDLPNYYIKKNRTVEDYIEDIQKFIKSFNRQDKSLSSQLRPNSQKIQIFASDDNSDFILNADEYLKVLSSMNHHTTTFAFAGTSQSSCEIAFSGTEFEKLAQKTQGKVFDLCEQDWSNHFTELTSSIEQKFKRTYQETREGQFYVKEVKLDDEILSPYSYGFDAQSKSLTIRPNVDLSQYQNIHITYQITR